jgi:ABC-type methionine transport system ATPase subunit
VHDPEIVLLDELTTRLDPAGREMLHLIGDIVTLRGLSVVLLPPPPRRRRCARTSS